MTATTDAIDRFIAEHFDGDATQALLAIAGHRDTAVAWMDREVFAREFADYGVTLTPELWTQVAGKLDGFDAYAGDPDTSVHADYAKYLLRELRVKNDAGDELDL